MQEKRAPAETLSEEPPLQGPEAGEVVAPPARDVTPNYQTSPLHQNTPLTREDGSPLPPPPVLEPLPPIFRQVIVTGPTDLELTAGKNRVVPISLAHIRQPEATRLCWFVGRQAPCLALGKTALQRFIRRRAIGCDWLEATAGQEQNGRRNATCYLGAGLKGRKAGEVPDNVVDLASWLVRFGWVEPMDGHYGDENQEAIEQKRGLYASKASSTETDDQSRASRLKEVSKRTKAAADAITSTLSGAEGRGR